MRRPSRVRGRPTGKPGPGSSVASCRKIVPWLAVARGKKPGPGLAGKPGPKNRALRTRHAGPPAHGRPPACVQVHAWRAYTHAGTRTRLCTHAPTPVRLRVGVPVHARTRVWHWCIHASSVKLGKIAPEGPSVPVVRSARRVDRSEVLPPVRGVAGPFRRF